MPNPEHPARPSIRSCRLPRIVHRALKRRVRPWLLIVVGCFLPVLAVALIMLLMLIDQDHDRPREQSVAPDRANPSFRVTSAPHIYLVVPDPSRLPFRQSRFPACEFRGPAGEVRVDRGEYGYWMYADHNGVYQVSCEPGQIMWTTVEVYYDHRAILDYFATVKVLEAMLFGGLLAFGLSFFVLSAGLSDRARLRRISPGDAVLPRATKQLLLSTLLTPPVASAVMIGTQVAFHVSRQPVSAGQINGYAIGVGVGVLGFWMALRALARMAVDPPRDD